METPQLLGERLMGRGIHLVTQDYEMQRPMGRLKLMYKLLGNDK